MRKEGQPIDTINMRMLPGVCNFKKSVGWRNEIVFDFNPEERKTAYIALRFSQIECSEVRFGSDNKAAKQILTYSSEWATALEKSLVLQGLHNEDAFK